MGSVDALFEEQPEPEAIAQPEPEPALEPAPEVEAQPAPEPTPEPTPTPEPQDDKRVPLATFLDARDEAKELRRKVAEYEAKATAPAPSEMPDPYDDPIGFANWQNANVEKALTNYRFQQSDLMARKEHGAEVVETAAKWAAEKAKADPGFAQSYMNDPDPLGYIVRQHKREETLGQIGDKPLDDFVRDYIAKNPGLIAAPTPALVVGTQQPAQAAPEPPRSLAAQPSKGGGVKDVPTGPLSAVESLFTR